MYGLQRLPEGHGVDVTWYKQTPGRESFGNQRETCSQLPLVPLSQCPSSLATGDITCLRTLLWLAFLHHLQGCFKVIDLGAG